MDVALAGVQYVRAARSALKLHADIRFSVATVIAFALVVVLLPMSMLATGCDTPMLGSHLSAHGVMGGPVMNELCTMVKDPNIPDALASGGLTSFLMLIVALFAAFVAFSLPRLTPARAVIPVAEAPPPPPEPPLGERLRL